MKQDKKVKKFKAWIVKKYGMNPKCKCMTLKYLNCVLTVAKELS